MQVRVSIAQFEIFPNDPSSNLSKAKSLIEEAKNRGSDIVVFPELWSTGLDFAYNKAHKSEHLLNIEKAGALAAQYKIWLIGTMINVDDQGKLLNTCFMFNPNGLRSVEYSKTHLFRLMQEHLNVAEGKKLCTFGHSFGKSGFAICYDLRFPELFRTYALEGAKVIFISSAFPRPREDHWKTLVRARAIENQVYIICCNRCGIEKVGDTTYDFFGASAIIDPWGKTIVEAGDKEVLLTADVDFSKVEEIRKTIPIFEDRRTDLYKL